MDRAPSWRPFHLKHAWPEGHAYGLGAHALEGTAANDSAKCGSGKDSIGLARRFLSDHRRHCKTSLRIEREGDGRRACRAIGRIEAAYHLRLQLPRLASVRSLVCG